MKRTTLSVLTIALAAPMVAASIQAASAAPAPAKGPAAQPASGASASAKTPAVIDAKLAGYQQVNSGALTDPAGSQVSGTATCPVGTRVIGGGAVISSSSLSENLNASVPLSDKRSWKVYVNNAGSTDGTFTVYAVCVKRVQNYSIVIGTGVDNPANTQVAATATCPSGTVPFGGGGFASSGSTLVNLNTSIPQSNGWRADVNNASTGGNTATAYVVCGTQPAGYKQVTGTATTLQPNTQASASVSCPGTTVAFSGGGFSSTSSTAVNLNSTFPLGLNGWRTYEDNGSTGANTITAYAVCGRAAH